MIKLSKLLKTIWWKSNVQNYVYGIIKRYWDISFSREESLTGQQTITYLVHIKVMIQWFTTGQKIIFLIIYNLVSF